MDYRPFLSLSIVKLKLSHVIVYRRVTKGGIYLPCFERISQTFRFKKYVLMSKQKLGPKLLMPLFKDYNKL